ncbi:hypothetical protein GCM10020218_027670 [Dactylosporangium vinaceum]
MDDAGGLGLTGVGAGVGWEDVAARAPEPELLDEAERMDVGRLRELQLERLRSTLRLAHARCPHYRRAFAAAAYTRMIFGRWRIWPVSP